MRRGAISFNGHCSTKHYTYIYIGEGYSLIEKKILIWKKKNLFGKKDAFLKEKKILI